MYDDVVEYPIDQCYNGIQGLKRAGVKVEMTQEQAAEVLKCSEDPIYFIETYCKILSTDDGLIPFKPFEYQKLLVKDVIDHRFVINVWPRQYGKTTIVAALFLWFAIFVPEYRMAVLANKMDQSQEILARIKMMYEYIPWWMQVGVTRWNEYSIAFGNRSSITGASTGGTSIRGKSFSMIMLDEFAWIDNDVKFYSSVYPTITSGTKTKIIITSTPNGLNQFYKIWKDSEEGRNTYHRRRVHWSDMPGRDAAWAEEQIRNTSERQFAVEFGCEFLGSADTLLSATTLQKLTFIDPIEHLGDQKEFKIYEQPKEGHSYVLSADVSEGIGLDYSVINVTDVTSVPYRQVAVMRTNVMPTMLFADLIYRVGTMYNDAVAVVENNSIGESVLRDLWEMEYENILMVREKGGDQKVDSGARAKMGVKTTVKTKAIGCSNLKALIESQQYLVQDFETVQELSNFIKKGRSFEADTGSNDDIVMTLVLFAWFSSQPYFTDWTSINSRDAIRSNILNQEDYAPFMFLDDGIGDGSDINWLFPSQNTPSVF